MLGQAHLGVTQTWRKHEPGHSGGVSPKTNTHTHTPIYVLGDCHIEPVPSDSSQHLSTKLPNCRPLHQRRTNHVHTLHLKVIALASGDLPRGVMCHGLGMQDVAWNTEPAGRDSNRFQPIPRMLLYYWDLLSTAKIEQLKQIITTSSQYTIQQLCNSWPKSSGSISNSVTVTGAWKHQVAWRTPAAFAKKTYEPWSILTIWLMVIPSTIRILIMVIINPYEPLDD